MYPNLNNNRKIPYQHRLPRPHTGRSTRDVAAAIRRTGPFTAQGLDRLTMLCLCHPGLHSITFLTEPFNLSCRSSHPGNFEELGHHPHPQSRRPVKTQSLPGSEDLRATPDHRGGSGNTPLPARLQMEFSISARVVSDFIWLFTLTDF